MPSTINKRPPSSKRHIADVETLLQYNAAPIYDVDSNDYDSVISNAASFNTSLSFTNNNNKEFCDDGKVEDHDDDDDDGTALSTNTGTSTYVTGISISNWDIQTASSTIANESEMDALTSKLQELANQVHQQDNENDDGIKQIQRRLNSPEIVFMNAFVQLKLKKHHNHNMNEEEEFKLIHFTWNATDALGEWASCHSYLNTSNTLKDNGIAVSVEDEKERNSYCGVSIIQSIDAKLWSERQKKQQQQSSTSSSSSSPSSSYFDQNAISTSNEFNYDWTFSTPYTGTSTIILNPSNTNSTTHFQKQNLEWIPSSSSFIDISLLTDQTQPILYYDEINLYEDDMHDNGYVSLRCKLRVMPTCLYVLQSLFVRVDHVIVRVREVRTFCKFESSSSNGRGEISSSSSSPTYRLCRDISWRECKWDELSKHNLPTFVGSWRIEDENAGPTNQNRIQGLVRSLPVVDLPSGMNQFSYVDVSY